MTANICEQLTRVVPWLAPRPRPYARPLPPAPEAWVILATSPDGGCVLRGPGGRVEPVTGPELANLLWQAARAA